MIDASDLNKGYSPPPLPKKGLFFSAVIVVSPRYYEFAYPQNSHLLRLICDVVSATQVSADFATETSKMAPMTSAKSFKMAWEEILKWSVLVAGAISEVSAALQYSLSS